MTTKKMGRPKKVSAPFQADAEIFNQAILKSRLSPREIAYRFGRPEAKIREMMEGLVKPDIVILRSLNG